VILDTNAVSALLGGDPGISSALESRHRHSIPVIALGEYRFGLLASARRTPLEARLFGLVRDSKVLPVNQGTTAAYAEIREELRVRGTPIPPNDLWIAALARQHDEPIVSRDRHFDRVEGVTRVGW
jgi:predicted nucleic acid-binding protein